MDTHKKSQTILELLPLLIFFVCYKFYGIKTATISIVLATIASTALNYIYNKHFSVIAIVTTVIISILGTITVLSDNTIFIKIKPTIVNLIFAAILLFGMARKRGYLKNVLGAKFEMTDKAWLELSKRFALLFILLALLNELVWRLCSESTWVTFKVFGILIIMCIFMLAQAPFLNRNRLQ